MILSSPGPLAYAVKRLGLCLLLMILSASGMAEFDPRRFDDLSAVITLCATAPRSPEFDSTWRQWLETNPAADLDGAIATVISRAETIRSMAVSGMEVRRSGHRFSAAEIAEHMQQLGRRTRADVASSKDSSSKITVIASGSSQH